MFSMNGASVRGRYLSSRKLQTTSLLVEYEIIIEANCAASQCSDPQAVQDIANAIYDQVTGSLKEAIDNGSLVQDLQISTSSTALASLFDNAVATGDFSTLVVPLLALISKWYPDWDGRSRACKNDGQSPLYMKLVGTYYEKSLDACCTRFYSWDYFTCMGDAGTAPSGFYPNWGEAEIKCLDATKTAETMPAYFQNNPEQWTFDNVHACCKQYYSWDYTNCIVRSGGESTP